MTEKKKKKCKLSKRQINILRFISMMSAMACMIYLYGLITALILIFVYNIPEPMALILGCLLWCFFFLIRELKNPKKWWKE